MSELYLLNKPNLCNLLLSDIFYISSLILSHPLYFSSFIFFSPNILNLLFFLSPLFLTTSLLAIAFLTLIHGRPLPHSYDTQLGFLQATYIATLNRLRSNIDLDIGEIQVNHVLELVFDMLDVLGREDFSLVQSSSYEISCVMFADLEEKTLEIVWEQITSQSDMEEEEKPEGFLKEFGIMMASSEDEGESLLITGSDSIDGKKGESEDEVTGDDEIEHTPKAETSSDIVPKFNNTDNDGEYTSERSSSRALVSFSTSHKGSGSLREAETSILRSYSSRTLHSSLGSYGSMRRDREWSRTLACKLFQDRHNVDGDEGMDLLWEMYEKEPTGSKNIGRGSTQKKKKKKKKMKNKSEDAKFYNGVGDDGDEEDEEGMSSGHLCCLQALKFSGGKVNLGMKKPSLVKISKAIKGIGWLHHVTRHGKRVHL